MIKYLSILIFFQILSLPIFAQGSEDCFACHEDPQLQGTKKGKIISVFINENLFSKSVHSELDCIDCHEDIDAEDLPHSDILGEVDCGTCHDNSQEMYSEGLHGNAFARGDPLAPTCKTCHGYHYIQPVKDLTSAVAPLKIPFLCGRCHREGTTVQLQRRIPEDKILQNYSLSIHGVGLLQKGLVVSATCVSCHSPHRILPHTDPRSTIARQNIAATCSKCHAEIETVHRKIIRGELWEKKAHVLPACVDCHQPHKIRNVLYEQGMADKDCLRCHEDRNLISSKDGRSLFVNYSDLKNSRHANISCSQCHAEVNASKQRACETITNLVDCSACHAEIGEQYITSIHGKLKADNNPNAPNCKECHGTHIVLGRNDDTSPIFPTNIPTLCAKCHREGEKAAVRYKGTEKNIIQHYIQSIHGKGLIKSGLTVTATCTDCHTAHHELPHDNPESSINPDNIAATCGSCHHGIEEQFNKSIHSRLINKTDKRLPVCNDCHSAHTIRRADNKGFELEIMQQCGNCHPKIAATYFNTYHGKVSQLGYTKTAKCYNCHGAHDILPPEDPKSHLSHENIVETCKTCHPGAHRQFAGYFTHATHHDPGKYPFLFWTFWGMTGLLVGTFLIAGLHTLLWLPRSLQWKRELKRKLNQSENTPEEDEIINNEEQDG